MIDILTLNYNDFETTSLFVDHVKKFACVSNILIVDNKSSDNSFSHLKKLESEKIHIISSKYNGGYGSGNNIGIKYLKNKFNSKFVLLANPDVIVDEDALKRLESFLMCNENYAVASPIMLDNNKKIQYNTAFKIPSLWKYILSLDLFFQKIFNPYVYPNISIGGKHKDVDAVSGSMFMMNVDIMLRCGMFDEQVFLYCEEFILGMKLKKCGVKTALLCDSFFIHNHSVSISKTFKSITSKRKLMMDSSLYVLKRYYKANPLTYFIGVMIAKISILEVLLVSLLKKD